MSSRLPNSTASGGVSRSSQSNSQRRHRSRSTSRYADLDKPKKKKTLSATTSLVSIPNTIKLSMLNSGLLSFDKVKLEARDENNSLSQTIPDKPIELRHFVKLCEQRRKFPVLYKLEFQTAAKVETNTCRHATRKNNLEKNQNQKCIPYDYNRVVLEKIPGIADSDYVNASYVDSLLKPNAYIVTQGPTEETVNEFWRMVWQENVSAIVMLTKTFDFTKVMCVQYWPPNIEIHESYGDININIVKEEQLANFQIRTFRLYKKNGEAVTEERLILQFHYTEWHSHTCPFSNAVLEFRRRVRAVVGNIIKPNSMIGPMLVHCNDGGGRSGVYLAVDANLELAEEEDCFHVFGYLKKLRQSRKGLIENVDQYKFVYDTLEEHIVCGKTWFPVAELSERLKAKAKKDLLTKMNEYQREYAQISKQTPRFTIGDCAGGHRADNREKNRDVLCVPPDNFRPYLTSFQGNAFTDYINSVFVDGYTKPREYIVTEWPLKHTLGEFWSLVYDHECSAVVVLCNPPPNSQQYPSFWPQKSKMEKYGPVFSVHFVSGKHFQNIKQWEYKINKKIISLTEMMAGVKAPTKTVQLFQLTCWPMGHKVPTSTNSLVFLMNMVELWRQRNDYGPVCVVSPDGRSRAGVYCAANACIEQVIQHGEVDVFQAVKTVRRHRPQLIDNMTEYKYCYDLVLHYVLHFLDKEHKEKKFIAFGRGKCIPLTPDNLNADLPTEICNTGRIIVNKYIEKIDKRETLLQQQQQQVDKDPLARNERSGKILERKKKGRLYSLGGNEPVRKGYKGRLDRLKTVGTFDLGTEMGYLSEVARNLNEQLITGELSGIMSDDNYSTHSPRRMVPPIKSSLSTPETRKRDNSCSSYRMVTGSNVKMQQSYYGEVGEYGIRAQHSADDCIQRQGVVRIDDVKKSRSLSTSSYLDNRKDPMRIEEDGAGKPKPITEGGGVINKTRKSMLRKSRRIVRTDSEIINEGIINENLEYTGAGQSSDDLKSEEPGRLEPKGSATSSSMQSRKDSSDVDDLISPKDYLKSTDDSSRNMSADEMDAVFSDSNTDIEKLEKEYKELMKSSLQREYKSDGDTLDEAGKRRSEFGKWKNQSLEHEIELKTTDECDEPIDEEEDIERENRTISSQSCETSADIKDISRICSPITNGSYSDSGMKDHIINAKIRNRVYSSSRVGETPTERERLNPNKMKETSFNLLIPNTSVSDDQTLDRSSSPIEARRSGCGPGGVIIVDHRQQYPHQYQQQHYPIQHPYYDRDRQLYDRDSSMTPPIPPTRPSILQISTKMSTNTTNNNNATNNSKISNEQGTFTSLFEKRFGRFKKVNKLLKCKRFSTSTLYDKKTSTQTASPSTLPTTNANQNTAAAAASATGTTSASSAAVTTTKIETGGKSSFFFYKKSTSQSNNELSSRSSSKHKCPEISKSSSELGKYKASPFRASTKKKMSSKNNNSAVNMNTICNSPLSEEFYNKTGSVRLSAIELYEKFCSEDFRGLYKHELGMDDEGRKRLTSQHEYRLEKKGLRAIGRYNKNARLLKQKSEPKFSFQNDTLYYHEEDEYPYRDAEGRNFYGFYNERDEEYNVYNDEYGEDIEGDYYEDQECDFYEDDVEVASTRSEEPQIQEIEEIDENCAEADSDVDEIFLMPEEIKCSDDEYGFENKQFSLEQTMLGRASSRNVSLKYLDKISNDEFADQRSFTKFQDDEVLTIYKICSKEKVLQDDSESGNESNQDSVENAVNTYMKTVAAVDPMIDIKLSFDRVDSLELLSSSSGTCRSRSTLTEYAFDTVKNLNLESSSTSKLSLSLKSEIFDDITMTPEEGKPIRNCEFEDFTLTPDSSAYENQSNLMTIPEPTSLNAPSLEDEDDNDQNKVIIIVDKFLTSERDGSGSCVNLASETLTNAQELSDLPEHPDYPIPEVPIAMESQPLTISTESHSLDDPATTEAPIATESMTITTSTEPHSFDDTALTEAPLATESMTLTTSTEPHSSDDPTTADATTADPITVAEPAECTTESTSGYTVGDLFDENDQTISLFTSELTKEFDRLFSRADEYCKDFDQSIILSDYTTATSPVNNQQRAAASATRIPSRYSMQKLELYHIPDEFDDDHHRLRSGPTPSEFESVVDVTAHFKEESAARFKKNRSQSLGNLSGKTKCFPL